MINNIVILAGGTSKENEISIYSGIEIWKVMNELGYNAILINVSSDINENINFSERRNYIDNNSNHSKQFIGKGVINICKQADIVFLALHGGDGENGKIQALFDLLNIKYTGNDYFSSAITMNKWITKQVLLQNNILVPTGIIINKGKYDINEIIEKIKFPYIFKPVDGGSSIDLYLIKDMHKLDCCIQSLLNIYDKILIEEFIKGREFSVGTIKESILPPIEIINEDNFFDYNSKYFSNKTKEICPAELSDDLKMKISKTTLQIINILNLDIYSRVDYIIDKDENLYCLEVNSLPGMTRNSLLPKEALANNIVFNDLCKIILQLSANKYID